MSTIPALAVKYKKYAKKKRRATQLPIIGKKIDCIYNRDGQILHKLALPDTALARQLFGFEQLQSDRVNILICLAPKTTRYLILRSKDVLSDVLNKKHNAPDREFAIASLVIKLDQQQRHVIDTIHVEENYRRLGFGLAANRTRLSGLS